MLVFFKRCAVFMISLVGDCSIGQLSKVEATFTAVCKHLFLNKKPQVEHEEAMVFFLPMGVREHHSDSNKLLTLPGIYCLISFYPEILNTFE